MKTSVLLWVLVAVVVVLGGWYWYASTQMQPTVTPAPPLLGGAAARPEAWIHWLAWVGIALTAVNMFGGFAVTQRMLQMFRK